MLEHDYDIPEEAEEEMDWQTEYYNQEMNIIDYDNERAKWKYYWLNERDNELDVTNSMYPHHKWRKGSINNKKVRFNKKYINWRENVIQKQAYKCGKCGSNKAEHCHHILNYSSHINLRYDVKNGLLFCKECHEKFHELFGKLRNDGIQLKYFLRGF